MATATAAPQAPAVTGTLTGLDLVTRDALVDMAKVSTAARHMTTLLHIRRAIRWAESTALGEDLAVIAFKWGVKAEHLQHPFYGSSMGFFLVRAGVTVEMETISAKDRARAAARGEMIVGDYAVDVMCSGAVWAVDKEIKRLRAAVKTTDLPVPEGTSKNEVVKGWLERAASLDELESLRTAYMAVQGAKSKEPALDRAATAALGEVTFAPSDDLIRECQRVLALVK